MNFSLSSGETIALLGQNGAGKSTLLRILAKVCTPEAGEIVFQGHNILKGKAADRKGIFFCGHAPGLYPSLSASENLYYLCALNGYTPSESQIRSVLHEFGLKKSHIPVRVCSLGMLQRLKLCLVELVNWKLLLIDEPFNSLDIHGQSFIKDKLSAWKDDKRSIIFVDHDLDRALALCDRVLVLQDGSIAMDQPTTVGIDLQENIAKLFD